MAQTTSSDKYLTDPVVGMIGIGDYGSDRKNLDGIPVDYQNIMDVFSKIYNYKVLVKKNNNKFQTRWTCEQIDSFISEVRSEWETKKHDGLIFIISCHGTEENKIYDSDGETYPLEELFDYFNGKSCRYLIGKPKIFIIDSCRGEKKSRPFAKLQNQQNVNGSSKSGIKWKSISNEESDKYYHCDSNFCFIFANTEGNKTLDTDKAGGLLIQSVAKVFSDTKFIHDNDLDKIIRRIRKETKLVSTHVGKKIAKYNATQIVENRSTMEDSLFFRIPPNMLGGQVLPDPSSNKNDFKVLLKAWGLQEYISKFEDEGWDDPEEWEELCEDDDGTELAKEGLIIKKGHRRKFVKRWRETFAAKKDDEKDEEKNNGNPNREIFPGGINIVPFEKQEYKLRDGGKGFLANQVSILRTRRDKEYSLGGKKDVAPGAGARVEESKREPEKLFCSREHKIILLCGETGVGKSTLINSMMNYIYDVQYSDKFRLRLIEENSGTQHISSYRIKQPKGGNINYDLTIIDTPGFGGNEKKDKQIAEEFQYILDNILSEINGICFVVKSTDTRLDESQANVFNSILNLLAKDISNNIFILMTFADGKKANCIDALDGNDILKNVQKRFQINNSAFTDDPLDENFDSTDVIGKYYWDMGRKCLKTFFDELNNVKPQSTEKSKEALKQRDAIQAKMHCLFTNFHHVLAKQEEVNNEIEFIKKNEKDINAGKCVIYTKSTQVWEKIEVSKWVVNCNKQKTSCHVDCGAVNPYWCNFMTWGGYCSICGCGSDEHVMEKYQWKYIPKIKKISNWDSDDDLKDSFEKATKNKQRAAKRIESLERQLKQLKKREKSSFAMKKNLQNKLERIALRPKFSTVGDYIDQLIENEINSPKPNAGRIQSLKDLKKTEKIIEEIAKTQNVDDFIGKLHDGALK